MFRDRETTFLLRKAGLSFKDLGVFVYGSDAVCKPLHIAFGIPLMGYTDYQKTVGSLPLAGLGALRGLILQDIRYSEKKCKIAASTASNGTEDIGLDLSWVSNNMLHC